MDPGKGVPESICYPAQQQVTQAAVPPKNFRYTKGM